MKTKRLSIKLLPATALFISLIFAFPAKAQVTIGSDEEPVEGSMLQLKNEAGVTGDNVNATKGLSFPRVNLSDKTKLYPMFEDAATPLTPNAEYAANADQINAEHTGMMVYNMYTSDTSVTDPNLTFHEGFYYWDGEKWVESGEGGGNNCGGVIPYSSGTPVALLSAELLNGLLAPNPDATVLSVGQAIGFGSSSSLGVGVNLLGATIDLSTPDLLNTNISVLNNAFVMPETGTISNIYASFTSTATIEINTLGLLDNPLLDIPALGNLLEGILNTTFGSIKEPAVNGLKAVLYGETAPGNKVFKQLAILDLDTQDADLVKAELGTTFANSVTNANIPVTAGCRYFFAIQANIETGDLNGGLLEMLGDAISRATLGVVHLPSNFGLNDLLVGLLGTTVVAGNLSGGISLACNDNGGDGDGDGGTTPPPTPTNITATNGVNMLTANVVKLGGSLTQATNINMAGQTFDIITGTANQFNVNGGSRTDSMFIDNVQSTAGNSKTLVWNVNTKKVEAAVAPPVVMTFTQSSDETNLPTTMDTEVPISWTEGDVITNTLTTLSADGTYFELKEDANVEMSGYIGFIANQGATIGSGTYLVNATLQIQKAGNTTWENYTSVRGVYSPSVNVYRATLSIPPALLPGGKAGDRIRMIIVMQPEGLGTPHPNPYIVVPYGTKFSKSLKIVSM